MPKSRLETLFRRLETPFIPLGNTDFCPPERQTFNVNRLLAVNIPSPPTPLSTPCLTLAPLLSEEGVAASDGVVADGVVGVSEPLEFATQVS